MLKLIQTIPAMKKILVSGNNKITEFVHNFLPLRGYEVIDITQLSAFQNNPEQLKGAECILDLNNTNTTSTDSMTEYDAEFVKELIDFAKTIKTSYLFGYQETENQETESFLINILDFVDDYCKEKDITYAKTLIGDIYGTELTTSEKLDEILRSIVEEKPIYVENDTKDYYLLNQTDFIEGLEEVTKAFKTNKSLLKTYTLLPEEPLTEIELVHFIQDLNELELDINYSEENIAAPATDLSLDVNYPENWYPKVDLEQGLKALMSSYGIPVYGTAAEELAEEEFLLNENKEKDNFDDDPLINMWDETSDADTDVDNDKFSFDAVLRNDNVDPYAYLDAPKAHPKPKVKKIRNKKAQKAKLIALAGLLTLSAISPSIIYATNYSKAKSLVAESIYHLKQMDLAMAKEKSSTAIAKLEMLNTNPLFTKFAFFKKDQDHVVESSARVVSYLADNFQFNTNNNVLGSNTYSGIDKSFEIVSLLENEDSPELKEILKNKDLIKNLKEINPTLQQVLGYNSEQKYLVLFSDKDTTKPFGSLSFYSVISMKDGKYAIEKTEKIEVLDSSIALNANSAIDNLTNLINDQKYLEEGIKKSLNVFNYLNTQKISGVLLITPDAVSALNSDNKFNSIEKANSYTSHLLEFSSNNIENLLNAFNKNSAFIYFKDENLNIPYKKNNWTGKLSESTDDSLSIITDTRNNNKLIESLSFIGENTDTVYKRTLEINLNNTSDKENLGSIQVMLPKDAMLTQGLLIESGESKNITKTFELEVSGNNIIYKTNVLLEANKSAILQVSYESMGKTSEDGYMSFGVENNPGITNTPIKVAFNYPAGVPNTNRIPDNMQINNNSIEYSGTLNSHLILEIPL